MHIPQHTQRHKYIAETHIARDFILPHERFIDIPTERKTHKSLACSIKYDVVKTCSCSANEYTMKNVILSMHNGYDVWRRRAVLLKGPNPRAKKREGTAEERYSVVCERKVIVRSDLQMCVCVVYWLGIQWAPRSPNLIILVAVFIFFFFFVL